MLSSLVLPDLRSQVVVKEGRLVPSPSPSRGSAWTCRSDKFLDFPSPSVCVRSCKIRRLGAQRRLFLISYRDHSNVLTLTAFRDRLQMSSFGDDIFKAPLDVSWIMRFSRGFELIPTKFSIPSLRNSCVSMSYSIAPRTSDTILQWHSAVRVTMACTDVPKWSDARPTLSRLGVQEKV